MSNYWCSAVETVAIYVTLLARRCRPYALEALAGVLRPRRRRPRGRAWRPRSLFERSHLPAVLCPSLARRATCRSPARRGRDLAAACTEVLLEARRTGPLAWRRSSSAHLQLEYLTLDGDDSRRRKQSSSCSW